MGWFSNCGSIINHEDNYFVSNSWFTQELMGKTGARLRHGAPWISLISFESQGDSYYFSCGCGEVHAAGHALMCMLRGCGVVYAPRLRGGSFSRAAGNYRPSPQPFFARRQTLTSFVCGRKKEKNKTLINNSA